MQFKSVVYLLITLSPINKIQIVEHIKCGCGETAQLVECLLYSNPQHLCKNSLCVCVRVTSVQTPAALLHRQSRQISELQLQ